MAHRLFLELSVLPIATLFREGEDMERLKDQTQAAPTASKNRDKYGHLALTGQFRALVLDTTA